MFNKSKKKSAKKSNRVVSIITDSEIGDRALLDDSLQLYNYEPSPNFRMLTDQGENNLFTLKVQSYGNDGELFSTLGRRNLSIEDREVLL